MEEIIPKKNIEDVFNKRIKISLEDKNKKLIIDYLYYLLNLNLLDEKVTINDLIDRINEHLEKIIFFDENHEINKKHGRDFKGKTSDGKEKGKRILYVRDKLEYTELTFYHELTHLLNTTFNTDGSIKSQGLVDSEESGSIFNEVIVQYTAERIYNEKYHLTPKFILYSGEEIRMLPNTKAASNMKNYQMYDSVVSLFLNMIGIEKEELARKQFILNNNLLEYINEQYNITMTKIEKIAPKLNISEKFKEKNNKTTTDNKMNLIDYFDYIYITDVFLYTQPNEAKKLKEGETIDYTNSTKTKKYPLDIKRENEYYQYLINNSIRCQRILKQFKEEKKQR